MVSRVAPRSGTRSTNADLLITVGVFFTDLISGFFSQHLDESHRIGLLPHRAVVAGTVFGEVPAPEPPGAR